MSLLRAFSKRADRKTAKSGPVTLRLEALEDRLVPASAGVWMDGGDLKVFVGGGVEITAGTTPGEVIVRGLDWSPPGSGAGPSGTSSVTQVGRTDALSGWHSSVTVEGVTGDVDVLLNPHAQVVLTNMQIPGHLHIQGFWCDPGAPWSDPNAPRYDFAVRLDGVAVHDDVEIKATDGGSAAAIATSNGYDPGFVYYAGYRGPTSADVHILNSDIGDDCNVRFSHAAVEVSGSHVGDDLDVNTDTSGNTVRVLGSHISSSMGLDLRNGASGPNQVQITGSTFDDDVEVHLNHTGDAIHVQGSTFHDDLDCNGDGSTAFWDDGGNSFDDLNLHDGIREVAEAITPLTTAPPAHPQPPPPGPRVIQSTPFPDHVLVTFDKAVAVGSFTPDQVSVADSAGQRTPVQRIQVVPGSLDHSFDIYFRPFASGGYRMVIGPGITDTSGHAMDQNGNGVNGENPGDRFTIGNFTKPQVQSAVPAYGHIRVTFNELIDPASLTTGDVTLTDRGGKRVPVLGVHPAQWSAGYQFDIDVAAFPRGGYLLAIKPNARDEYGNRMAAAYSTKCLDNTPPQVVGITEQRVWFGITVTFSEPIDPSKFTAAAVTIALRSGRRIPVREVREVPNRDSRMFDIRFQADPGDYHLTLDTSIVDLFGNHLAGAYQDDFLLRLEASAPTAAGAPFKDLSPYAGAVLPYHIDPADPASRAMLQTLTQRTDSSTPSLSTDRAASPVTASAVASGLRNGGLIQADGRTALGSLPGSQLDKPL